MTCITGDETGLVKIWDIKHSSSALLKSTIGEQKRAFAIQAMCWRDTETSVFACSMKHGMFRTFKLVNFEVEETVSVNIKCSAVLPNALAFVKDKYIIVANDGNVLSIDEEAKKSCEMFKVEGKVDAVHIHSKYQLLAYGGRENELHVFDLQSERYEMPLFTAREKYNNILDIPEKTFVTGVCVVNPFVYCTCSAFHCVSFYDRRVNNKPVQEYEVSREIDRRPTRMMQWNTNKFLIGEASGDVHLYDTRRGFTSRAKLRGGVGSVKCMSKHPAGIQLLAVTGLDRKARIYHVPTGKLLMSIYVKQRCNCVLLSKEHPMTDNAESYNATINTKRLADQGLGNDVWDDMDPVVDLWDSTVGKGKIEETSTTFTSTKRNRSYSDYSMRNDNNNSSSTNYKGKQ